MRSRLFSALLLFLGLGASQVRVSAMSVRAPTFPELVAESAVVAHARVTSVISRAVTATNGQRAIKTFVTFATVKALKGTPPAEFTLSFLGGTAEGETWTVPGMPTFAVGAEEIVFTTGEESICPLVGAMHGRYRILNDAATGRRYVARDNHAPLTNTDEVSHPVESAALARTPAAAVAAALTPEDFENRIASEVAHPSRTSTPP